MFIPSFANERWQVVVLPDASYKSPIALSGLHNVISQRLTLALSAANFDVHNAQHLGLPNCIIENCTDLTDRKIRQQAIDSGKSTNLALLYRVNLTKQNNLNSVSRQGWNFKLTGRLLDLESGTEQDAFTLDSPMKQIAPHCLGQCFRDKLEQHAGLLAQELGAILSEKLASVSRRFSYHLHLNGFILDELYSIDHYLKNLDSYIAETLLSEFYVKAQWFHRVSSREYRYISTQSSSALGNQLQYFLNDQGISANLHYEVKKIDGHEQRIFTITRTGTPYLTGYNIAVTVLLLVFVTLLSLLKKHLRFGSLRDEKFTTQITTTHQTNDINSKSNIYGATNDYPATGNITHPKTHHRYWGFFAVIFCVFLFVKYWYDNAKLPQSIAIQLNEEKSPSLEQPTDTITQPVDLDKRQELRDWYQAKELDDIASYQHYINVWPKGQYAVYAKKVLNFKIEDNHSWLAAQTKNNIAGYQHYLDEKPMGEFAELAQQRLLALLAEQERLRELQRLVDVANNYYFEQKNYREALHYYQQAASKGAAQAQFQLAFMYAQGHGLPLDNRLAAKWYKLAAQQSHKQAQARLGYMFSKGLGVERTSSEALYWYRKAAEQGVMIAQYNLAYMYDKGQGIQQDNTQAVFWYAKAAEQGYADAQNNLATFYESGKGTVKNLIKAKGLYQKAASQGHQGAKVRLLMLGK